MYMYCKLGWIGTGRNRWVYISHNSMGQKLFLCTPVYGRKAIISIYMNLNTMNVITRGTCSVNMAEPVTQDMLNPDDVSFCNWKNYNPFVHM